MKLRLHIHTDSKNHVHADTWPFVDFVHEIPLIDGVNIRVRTFIDGIYHFEENK